MENIGITSAQYMTNIDGDNVGIYIVEDGVTRQVPLDSANRHYAEIMRQVEAGTLTIAPAEEVNNG